MTLVEVERYRITVMAKIIYRHICLLLKYPRIAQEISRVLKKLKKVFKIMKELIMKSKKFITKNLFIFIIAYF